MRLFLAVPLDDAVRDAVAEAQNRLKAIDDAEVRWAEPESFHLTVKFIGDQPDPLLPEIEDACGAIASGAASFRFRVRGASYFPKRGPLKTLWIGLSEGADAWRTLAQRAETPLAAFGVAREGGLVPHITLGRVKAESDALRAALGEAAAIDCGAQTAGKIVLFQSFLDPRGATHKPLREWSLSQQGA